MNRIRVLLADDHEVVRQGLRLLIDDQPDMEVTGEASDGEAAVTQAERLQPTVAVVDISMRHMNGLEATREIRRVAPKTAIVVLTRHDDESYVQELMAAGATGYVLKQSAPRELLTAIRITSRGTSYRDSSLANRASVVRPVPRYDGARQSRLSERETEVLRLMALGHSNKEIASDLQLSVKTIEIHKANAMRKLGLHGRSEIVRFALLQGWLTL